MGTAFRKFLLIVSVLFLTASLASAQLPSGIGWHDLGSNTILNSVCACSHGFPDICYIEGCSAITADWNSGAFDTTRNRLLIWGGGHTGYAGNEVYALNLDTMTTTRLTDPTTVPYVAKDSDPYLDGKPSSRHTYDCTVYMANVDRMFQFAGAIYGDTGTAVGTTWTLNLSNLTWQLMNPSGETPFTPQDPNGVMCVYDPVTAKIFIRNKNFNLYSYDFSTNSYAKLNSLEYSTNDRGSTGIIDLQNRMFVTVGDSQHGGVRYYDITGSDSYARHVMATTGGDTVIAYDFPGLAYDTDQKKIVAWAGGDTVYVLTPNYVAGTGTWTPYTFSGGPGAAMMNGTYKRFAYSPASKVFILYNQTNQPGYILRISNYSSLDTTPPSTPTNLNSAAVSSSQINLTWTASTDPDSSVGGYRIYRGATQVGTSSISSYSDTGLSPVTSYTYTVSAYDPTGNVSAQSSPASATTQANSISTSKFPGIPGCTNAYYIDADCDGYGPGSPNGPDADDNDATINTSGSTLAKYTITQYLTAKGYPTGSVYYVATNGNDSTGTKNDATKPYLSWSAVNALLQAGDVVMFRAGTYLGSARTTIGEYGITTTKKGTAGRPIVIMNYPGEKAIIDTTSQGISVGGTSHSSRGGSYVIFDGLVVANTRNTGYGNGFNVEYSDNCIFKNIEEYGYVGSFWSVEDIQGLTLENSVIRNNGEHGIYLGANAYPGANVTLRNNIFRNNGWHGMKWNGRVTNLIIQNNIIHSNGASGLDFENGVSNSLIDHNYIFNNENQGIMIYDYPSTSYVILPYSQTGNTISNNVIWVGKYNPENCADANTTSLFSGIRFMQDVTPAAWQANHAYDYIDTYSPVTQPTTPNGYIYMLKTPGPSGSSEPTWNTTPGGTTNDGTGTLQWITIVPPVFDNNTISNNKIVTNNGPQILFSQDDFWDTTTISRNTFFSTGTGSVMKTVSTNYNMTQFNAKSSSFTNNIYGDPGFTAASVNYCVTPENFNFTMGGPPVSPPVPPNGLTIVSP